MKNTLWGGLLLTVAATASVAALAAGGTAVYINGKKASSQVRMIGGVAYVPLADVARAYNGQVAKRSDGDFEIGATGGAYQVGKYQGKIGQEVFTGQYRFSVVSVDESSAYTTKYRSSQDTLTPSNSGQKLIVVACRVKNGTPVKQSLIMTVGGQYGSPNTALATEDGESYPPMSWHGDSGTGGVDVHGDLNVPTGITLLPGAARNLNLIFELPKDSKAKDLIFCLTPYDEWTKGDKKKFTDVRVSLAKP